MATYTGYKLQLKNFRHIPNLRMNILYIGVLDYDGFTSHFAQVMWKLVRGFLVIDKGKKCCSLHKTKTSLVRGEVNVSSLDFTTYLWHHRLGHISEKGLATLKTQNLLLKINCTAISTCDHYLVGKQYRASLLSPVQGNLKFLSWCTQICAGRWW